MDVDYKNVGWQVVCVENCGPIGEVSGAPIVNVDANFLISPADQGADRVFPRMAQMRAMIEAAEKAGSLVNVGKIQPGNRNTRPYRHPDYAEEWKLLKKAWSLARNNMRKLSTKRIEEASATLYPKDPLADLEDWIWRLSLYSSQPGYEQPFQDVMKAIEPLWNSQFLSDFAKSYSRLAKGRGTRYFTVMSEFYSGYSEFGQVYFFVTKGLPIPADHHTTSTDFGAVKMFYGNAYEHFTSLVEYLAMLNNMLAGRGHDTFQSLTLQNYRKLDKPARFGPFQLNAPFMAICSEADNQLRNASHHGSFVFHQADQTIRYGSGKGGMGPEQQLTYANYLERSVRIYLQIVALLRIELIMANQLALRAPI